MKILLTSLIVASGLSSQTLLSEQKPKQSSTAASGVVVSGDRVRIGTSQDLIRVQGVLLSASQIIVPSAPLPQAKKPEQLIQLPKTETHELPRLVSPQPLEDRKPAH